MDGDDSRKKRDSDQVGSPASSAKEKLKKLKKGASKAAAQHREIQDDDGRGVKENMVPLAEIPAHGKQSGSISCSSSKSSYKVADVWDLESALHRISRIGAVQVDVDNVLPPREYLSSDEKSWVQYRTGHAGDASTIAAWYRRMKTSGRTEAQQLAGAEQKGDDNSLELWLADGLGDEDTPPAVFALLAEVITKDASSELGAVALLTQIWQDGKRLLKVDWHYGSSDLLARRLWLRLSILGLILSSELIVHETKIRDDCSDLMLAAGGSDCEG